MNVARRLQTAMQFADPTKKNATSQQQMRTDVNYLIPVLFKNVITMENYALFTAPVYVKMVKLNAREEETIVAV